MICPVSDSCSHVGDCEDSIARKIANAYNANVNRDIDEINGYYPLFDNLNYRPFYPNLTQKAQSVKLL
jgi:hypothetical protein